MREPSGGERTADLLRACAPQVLGALARRYNDFAAVEDAVQEALIAAAGQWPAAGVPRNPRGWLYQVARRRLADQARSDAARRRREEAAADLFVAPPDTEIGIAGDDALALLFMCCHPSLTAASAIALTLRAVGGLTTAEIAGAFLVPEATMAQRIARAKQTVRDSGVGFEIPPDGERGPRFDAMLRVLYLMFNEGYTSSSGESLHRIDLSNEAIRLTRLVLALVPGDRGVTGLLALMLLTDARRVARSGTDGELIPLDEQDRSLWDRAMIAEGTALVRASSAAAIVGGYQLQAAIAALHDEAPSTNATDWKSIEALYGLLEQVSDNPMVTLNRAVAVAMVHGPERGLDLLDALDGDAHISGHYRLDAVRGHLYERAGDIQRAVAHLRAAAAGTASGPERNYLLARAAKIEQADSR